MRRDRGGRYEEPETDGQRDRSRRPGSRMRSEQPERGCRPETRRRSVGPKELSLVPPAGPGSHQSLAWAGSPCCTGPRTQGSCLTPASAPQTWDQVTSLPWENFESPEGPGRGHGSTRAQPGGARRDRSPPQPVPPHTHTAPPRGADSEEHRALSRHRELWRACFCPMGPP